MAAPGVDDDRLAGMAKALGHPARLRIIRLLAERQACVTGDLVAELPLAQSTISEHLRILREAGLIQGEIEGDEAEAASRARPAGCGRGGEHGEVDGVLGGLVGGGGRQGEQVLVVAGEGV